MDCKTAISLRAGRIIRVGVLLVLVGAKAFTQNLPPAKEPSELLQLTEEQTAEYVNAVMAAKVPDGFSDSLILLVMNRSKAVVPELVKGIKLERSQNAPDDRYLHQLVDILAYAANPDAIGAISDLCNSDSRRFCYFVQRALSYASGGRSNPFTLAYRSLTRLEPGNSSPVAEWFNDVKGSEHAIQQWSEALVERFPSQPAEDTLRVDPLIQVLGGIPADLEVRLKALVRIERNGRK